MDQGTKSLTVKTSSGVTGDYASTAIFRQSQPQQQQQQQPTSAPEQKQQPQEVRAPVKLSSSGGSAVGMTSTVSINNHVFHQSAPVMYVKKVERTVASILGDDDDDEIGLDELDDEYLNAASSPSPPPTDFQRHNSMTRKQANSFVLQRSLQKSPVVSLKQLPPPLENCIVESDLEVLANSSVGAGLKQLQANPTHYHVHSHVAHSHAVHGGGGGGGHYTNRQHNNPIQIQFHAAGGVGGIGAVRSGMPATSPSTENLVLAPPPQFSDGAEPSTVGGGVHHHGQHHHMHYHQGPTQQQQQQQQKLGPNVRIVGAVPKSTNRF